MMPIIRVKKDKNHPYVMIKKDTLRDPELSLKAKGLMAFLLSKPDDWEIYAGQLATELAEHRQTVGRIIKELIKAGYCKRESQRTGKGKYFGYEYTIYEEKQKIRDAKCDTVNASLLINKETNISGDAKCDTAPAPSSRDGAAPDDAEERMRIVAEARAKHPEIFGKRVTV